MKKPLLLVCMLASAVVSAQTYSTGTLALSSTPGNTPLAYSAKVDVDASVVTLTLTGPSDRWMGIGFGESSMAVDGDVVIYDGTNLTDRTFIGVGSTPVLDAVQDWTLVSDQVETGVRTVVGTRALATGEANDYTFTPTESALTLVYARGQSIEVGYHGSDSCGTTTASLNLGTNEFSIVASKIFPNPSHGTFTIQSPVQLQRIAIYSQSGKLVKTLTGENGDLSEVGVDGLEAGIYLIELSNQDNKTWKKVIVN